MGEEGVSALKERTKAKIDKLSNIYTYTEKLKATIGYYDKTVTPSFYLCYHR